MKKASMLLCLGAALVLMSAVFRPGYRIIVNGHALPGIYSPEMTLRCSSAAIRAADEITREHEEPPYSLVPVICLKYTDADEQQLWGILLDSYEGVVKLYNVSLNGRSIGTVSNLREVYLLKNQYLPVWSAHSQLTVQETYTFPEAETPTEEVEAAFMRLSTLLSPV